MKLIGIAGRSCCGKSRVTKKLENDYGITRICQDRFFKKTAEDWESPEALNNFNLIYSLKKLKSGKPTHIPSKGWTEIYDQLIEPSDIIVVEGYLLFENDEIVSLLDKKIFIDVSDLNILYRRTKRDNTLAYIDYTMNSVIPKSYKYLTKQIMASDVVIDGNKNKEIVYNEIKKLIVGI